MLQVITKIEPFFLSFELEFGQPLICIRVADNGCIKFQCECFWIFSPVLLYGFIVLVVYVCDQSRIQRPLFLSSDANDTSHKGFTIRNLPSSMHSTNNFNGFYCFIGTVLEIYSKTRQKKNQSLEEIAKTFSNAFNKFDRSNELNKSACQQWRYNQHNCFQNKWKFRTMMKVGRNFEKRNFNQLIKILNSFMAKKNIVKKLFCLWMITTGQVSSNKSLFASSVAVFKCDKTISTSTKCAIVPNVR